MSQSPYQRVCTHMVQMFGPQFTDKFGVKNAAWEEALKDLSYAQLSAGLGKVLRSGLKFYEIDLPRFMELCRPPRAPMSVGEIPRMKWTDGMCEDELQMHFFANRKMFVWSWRHPRFGLYGPEHWSKEQNKALWSTCRRITHDFFLMREELGAENVPDEDLLAALHRAWSKIAG